MPLKKKTYGPENYNGTLNPYPNNFEDAANAIAKGVPKLNPTNAMSTNLTPEKPKQDLVQAREYIKAYGQKYGINDSNLGWYNNPDTKMTDLTLGGMNIGSGVLDTTQNRTMMDRTQLTNAIDNYAKTMGLKDTSAVALDNQYKMPANLEQAPAPYQSPYSDKIKAVSDKVLNATPYQSPYADKIQGLLDKVMNPAKFEYNPETDVRFQALKGQYQKAGADAFKNQMGAMSEATGGRLNSWAGSTASQAQQGYNERLMGLVPAMYDSAYNMYKNDLANNYNALTALNSQDATQYGRYNDTLNRDLSNVNLLNNLDNTAYARNRDTITDTKDLRNYINDKNYRDKAFDRGVYTDTRNFNQDNANNQFNQNLQSKQADLAEKNFNWQTDVVKNPSLAGQILDNDIKALQREALSNPESPENKTKSYQVAILKAQLDEAIAMLPYKPQEAIARINQIKAATGQIATETSYIGTKYAIDQQNANTSAYNSSISAGNLGVSQSRLEWEKNPKNPDNQYKTEQVIKAGAENNILTTIGPMYKEMMTWKNPAEFIQKNSGKMTPAEIDILMRLGGMK